jgi:ABC-type nitrate/sulfonate/bicarbonate transport system substrate-binding protein
MRNQCPGIEPQTLVIAEASSRRAGLIAGRLDAAMVPGDELLKLQVELPGRFHALAIPSRQFPEMLVDGLQANRKWALEHPEAVTDLLDAQLRAHRLIRANPAVLYEEAVKRLGLDLATAKSIADSHLSMNIWDPNGGLAPLDIQWTLDFLMNAFALPPGMRADQVADLSYLNTVLDDLGRVESPPSRAAAPSQPVP